MREPAWRKTGNTPDYRFTLANERTFLAWVRTSLALIAGALAIDQLFPDIAPALVRIADLRCAGGPRRRPGRRRPTAAGAGWKKRCATSGNAAVFRRDVRHDGWRRHRRAHYPGHPALGGAVSAGTVRDAPGCSRSATSFGLGPDAAGPRLCCRFVDLGAPGRSQPRSLSAAVPDPDYGRWAGAATTYYLGVCAQSVMGRHRGVVLLVRLGVGTATAALHPRPAGRPHALGRRRRPRARRQRRRRHGAGTRPGPANVQTPLADCWLTPSEGTPDMTTPATPASRTPPLRVARPGPPARLSAEALGTFLVVVRTRRPLFAVPQYNPLPPRWPRAWPSPRPCWPSATCPAAIQPRVTAGNDCRPIRLADAAAYVGAQLVGALLGALTLFACCARCPTHGTRPPLTRSPPGSGKFRHPGPDGRGTAGRGARRRPAGGGLPRHHRGPQPGTAAAPFAVGLSMAVLLQLGQAPEHAFNPARATASALFSSPDALGSCGSSGWPRWWARRWPGWCSAGFAQIPARPRRRPMRRRSGPRDGRRRKRAAEAGERRKPTPDRRGDAHGSPAPAHAPGADEARDFFDKRSP